MTNWLVHRLSGIATHFVHSSKLDSLKNRLAEIESPDHNQVHEIIEEFAVDADHQPEVYTLRGEERQTIDNCFKYNTVEEIVKSLKENGSKFALDTLDTILARSPSSVKITLEHLRRGVNLSFKECLNMEHQLWQTVPVSDSNHYTNKAITSLIVCSRFHRRCYFSCCQQNFTQVEPK